MAVFPHAPRGRTRGLQFIQNLLVFKCVHALPKSFVARRPYLAFHDHALHGLIDELFSRLKVPENIFAQHVVAPVDPNVRVFHAPDRLYRTVFVHLHRVQTARSRLDGEKRNVAIAVRELVNHLRKRKVGQAIAVVRQENLLSFQIRLDQPQAIGNRGALPGINKCNLPIVDIALHELKLPAALRKTKSLETDSSYSRK